MINHEFELLAPAGSLSILKAVIDAGADAVYVGGTDFGARAYADNFSKEELLEGLYYAHLRKKKVYLTVNTLLKNREIEEKFFDYLEPFYLRGLDAVLVQDFGVLRFVRRNFPNLPIHASTQMTLTGVGGAAFLAEQGVSRVVLSREVSLEEMQKIRRQTGMELEVFVHGALCYCYSGQCLFSSMLGARSGNRGRCAQPCRLPYRVLDEKKKTVLQDSYVLSLKDLCGIEDLPKLAEAGVYSLKIEGRMKQLDYAKGVVSVYRKYIELLCGGKAQRKSVPENGRHPEAIDWEERKIQERFTVSDADRKILLDCGNRCGFTDGYYHRKNGRDMVTFQKPSYEKNSNGKTSGWDDAQGMVDEADRHDSQDIAEEANRYDSQNIAERVNRQESQGSIVQRNGRKLLPICGELILKKDMPSELTLWLGETKASVAGDVVSAAKTRPLLEDEVRKRMEKTGETDFIFSDLDIQMEKDIFYPNGALNELRRKGLSTLKEALLAPYGRIRKDVLEVGKDLTMPRMGESFAGDLKVPENEEEWIAAVSEKRQLRDVLLLPEITTIYLSAELYGGQDKSRLLQRLSDDVNRVHQAGKKVYYRLPAIFREKTAKFYEDGAAELGRIALDGFVVHNYEEIYFVKKFFGNRPFVTDFSLYTYNDRAVRGFREIGAMADTVPLELNGNEIAHRANANSIMVVYGYYPLMISAQCVRCNTTGCVGGKKTDGAAPNRKSADFNTLKAENADDGTDTLYLRDRYKKLFPVKNDCADCYNVIYNSLPTLLFNHLKELRQAGIRRFRLDFTLEDERETSKVLRLFQRAYEGEELSVAPNTYTNGHYRRGVE